MYIPLIEAKLKNYCYFLYAVAFKNLETKIKDLKTKDGNKNIG